MLTLLFSLFKFLTDAIYYKLLVESYDYYLRSGIEFLVLKLCFVKFLNNSFLEDGLWILIVELSLCNFLLDTYDLLYLSL